jgi:hypothetical protein
MLTLEQTESPRPISDLAAGLTDVGLKILSKAGVRGNSVEMELETWRALTEELECELDVGSAFEPAFSLDCVIDRAIHRALIRVTNEFDQERLTRRAYPGRRPCPALA